MTSRDSRETRSRIDAREIGAGTTILLVSADLVALEPLRVALERAGHRVVSAEDAMGALAAVAAESPHSVVVDLFLPDTETPTFVRSLAERGYLGPVVALVPSDDLSDLLGCL